MPIGQVPPTLNDLERPVQPSVDSLQTPQALDDDLDTNYGLKDWMDSFVLTPARKFVEKVEGRVKDIGLEQKPWYQNLNRALEPFKEVVNYFSYRLQRAFPVAHPVKSYFHLFSVNIRHFPN